MQVSQPDRQIRRKSNTVRRGKGPDSAGLKEQGITPDRKSNAVRGKGPDSAGLKGQGITPDRKSSAVKKRGRS